MVQWCTELRRATLPVHPVRHVVDVEGIVQLTRSSQRERASRPRNSRDIGDQQQQERGRARCGDAPWELAPQHVEHEHQEEYGRVGQEYSLHPAAETEDGAEDRGVRRGRCPQQPQELSRAQDEEHRHQQVRRDSRHRVKTQFVSEEHHTDRPSADRTARRLHGSRTMKRGGLKQQISQRGIGADEDHPVQRADRVPLPFGRVRE